MRIQGRTQLPMHPSYSATYRRYLLLPHKSVTALCVSMSGGGIYRPELHHEPSPWPKLSKRRTPQSHLNVATEMCECVCDTSDTHMRRYHTNTHTMLFFRSSYCTVIKAWRTTLEWDVMRYVPVWKYK